MQKYLTYEHPLNERVRTILRMEFLFRQIKHFMAGKTVWDSRAVLSALMDILTLFSRNDLKTELIKELERHAANLARLTEKSGVDHTQLKNILHWLDKLRKTLHNMDGQLAQALRDDEFLAAISQRSSIPGGTCDFDLPLYHQWLHLPQEQRHADLERWQASIDIVRQAVELILKLIRNSAEPVTLTATAGAYQHTLDSAIPYQLIRIGIAMELPCYAEISGGKHRFTVRFMQPMAKARPQQVGEDVEFRLTVCAL
ncbi:MAG: cell division protein ZapD [Thiohalomonadaceae bacterium]